MIIKYTPPSRTLKEEIEAILNVGLELNEKGFPDAAAGLVKRGKALRDLIERWANKVSPAFIDSAKVVLAWAAESAASGKKPQFPNPALYDLENEKQRDQFVEDAQQSFQYLDKFYRDDGAAKRLPTLEPANRFAEMSNGLRRLADGQRPSGKVIIRNAIQYLFEEFTGIDGMYVEVRNPAHVQFFTKLCQDCKVILPFEDENRYEIVREMPGLKPDEAQKTSTTHKPKTTRKPREKKAEPPKADDPDPKEEMRRTLEALSVEELLGTYGLTDGMTQEEMIEKIVAVENAGA